MYPIRQSDYVYLRCFPDNESLNFEAAEIQIELYGCYENSTRIAKTAIQRWDLHKK